MRHEVAIDDFIITSDNSAGIGEKEQDVIYVSNTLTAKFAARVALLEQWAAGSTPQAVLVHNFSGASSWDAYVAGITELFTEAQTTLPSISGSTETNMLTQQSGIAITMIGKQQKKPINAELLCWSVYGVPLVGEQVIVNAEQVANMKLLKKALDSSLIERIWPVGSKGIQQEFQSLMDRPVEISTALDVNCSGGPATCVLVGVLPRNLERIQRDFGKHLYSISTS
ncbi:hypothetical protein [Planococcus versutus]|uniref:Alpha-ribazole-5-phosphate synthase n=1 Tax=Planococcus versutus TaxID=1302659 RepID=A0A1B1S2N2_9BACL|nr:hypothetical protein [Planococcus versutus]ANU27446.1 alpha-ribazole-5-phosphate synthase [Planococcus versutus]